MKDVFVLPEKWYIEVPKEEDCKLYWDYFKTTSEEPVFYSWFYTSDKHAYCEEVDVPKEFKRITTDKFKQYVLREKQQQKEIVGWKLKEDCMAYVPAIDSIISKENSFPLFGGETELSHKNQGFSIAILKQTGVLDLWFEPVYKQEEPKYNVGDWVTHIREWGENYDGIKTYKITKIDGEFVFVDWKACPTANDIKENFRKATPEEIKAAQTPQITINGYKGEFFDDYVKFGCAKIDKWLFVHFNNLSDLYPHSNKQIESITIGKGTFTKEQIKEIAEYYLNK